MKSFVSSLSFVVVSSLVFGCGGGDGPGVDGGDVDAAGNDAAGSDAAGNDAAGSDAAGDDAASMGPAPTLTYPAHAYTFLSPGNEIPPIVATATAEGTKTFAVEGDLPQWLRIDSETGTISGYIWDGTSYDEPPVGTFEVVVTLTDGADRKVEWPIVFTLDGTAETSHTVDIETGCAFCAVPTPSLVPNVHVGDFVVFSTEIGGEAGIYVDGAGFIMLDTSNPSRRVGINSGAGTTIGFSSNGYMTSWPGEIQVVY